MSTESLRSSSLQRQLEGAARRIEPILKEALHGDKDDNLSAAIRYHMSGGGKRVRPALCLLCCEALGGDSSRVLHFAAAVEILHNMLLIHDDIEDGDTIRRGKPTVWTRYGVPTAINAGDFMLGTAYRLMLQSPVDGGTMLSLLEHFTTTYQQTCRGQALDIHWRGRKDLTVEDYLRMVTLKTGHYLALGMVGGAIVAGLHSEGIGTIQELGRNMGPSFQIRDDVIDLTEGKGRGGVVGNDIREGKASILYARGLVSLPPRRAERLVAIMRKPREETSDEDVGEVIAMYEECGALEFARATADRLVQRAFETIEHIPTAKKGFFRQVAVYMVERMS